LIDGGKRDVLWGALPHVPEVPRVLGVTLLEADHGHRELASGEVPVRDEQLPDPGIGRGHPVDQPRRAENARGLAGRQPFVGDLTAVHLPEALANRPDLLRIDDRQAAANVTERNGDGRPRAVKMHIDLARIKVGDVSTGEFRADARNVARWMYDEWVV
jgi:hypothetical protein